MSKQRCSFVATIAIGIALTTGCGAFKDFNEVAPDTESDSAGDSETDTSTSTDTEMDLDSDTIIEIGDDRDPDRDAELLARILPPPHSFILGGSHEAWEVI